MSADGWLADTRISYDAVAASYAVQVRTALATEPYLRAALALLGPDDSVSGALLFARR